MKNLIFFVKGLGIAIFYGFLIPILVPLMLIDMVMWIGGADPLNTPIRKLIDKLPRG